MNEQLAETIGVEGYIYLYPLVLMDTTRRQITNVEKVSFSPLRTPADVFINIPAFPPADFRAVVRSNFDTLYSSAFLDLSEEPRIVSVPAAGVQRSSSARTAAFSVALLAGRAASTHRLQCDPTPANPPMSFADAFVAERHS
jgi:hypothetical protein